VPITRQEGNPCPVSKATKFCGRKPQRGYPVKVMFVLCVQIAKNSF
jgi:hypothetical protein